VSLPKKNGFHYSLRRFGTKKAYVGKRRENPKKGEAKKGEEEKGEEKRAERQGENRTEKPEGLPVWAWTSQKRMDFIIHYGDWYE
jgi:hypothetical protein